MEIAVISGKGGTGKSSISAAFATLNSKVVVADCDVDAANLYLLFNPTHNDEMVYIAGHKAKIDYNLCTNCGICADYCRFDAISYVNEKITISETSCDGCFLCSRICPTEAISMIKNDKSRMYSGSFRNGMMVYGRLSPGEENSGKLVSMVREKAKEVAKENNLDTIILDGPPGIGCPVISTITGVNKVVIITEPTISGLHDMHRTIELVQKFNIKTFVIINKFDLNLDISHKIDDWCKNHRISIIGHLPFDPNMVEAMVQGKTIIELNPELKISEEIIRIWNQLKN
ncbi:MAG: ATP-binding protein [Tenuifilaceae bacterium]